jgi:DNA-binding CsgD family transcriptional regulator
VLNRARSALRTRHRAAVRQMRRATEPDAHSEPAQSSAESAAIASEDRRAVLSAMAGLPRRAREVLILRYYLDLPDAEIATTLGVSRGTVSSTASRALAVLARELKELIRVIRVFTRVQVAPAGLSANLSGHFALIYLLTTRDVQRLDLTTGRLRLLPVNGGDFQIDTAW